MKGFPPALLTTARAIAPQQHGARHRKLRTAGVVAYCTFTMGSHAHSYRPARRRRRASLQEIEFFDRHREVAGLTELRRPRDNSTRCTEHEVRFTRGH